MNGQLIRTTDANPSLDVFFFDADALPVTTLTHATAGLTLAYTRAFNVAATSITLVTQTVTGAWASGGFVHRGGGVYRLDLPLAARAAGVTQIEIVATALPAGVRMAPVVVSITPDDLTVASPTDASIATAVDATLADNFSALPSAAAIATAVWTASTRELTTIGASIREAIADTFLGRAIQGGANGGRTVTSALRMVRNRQQRVGASMNYHLEDDTTVFTTAALTTDTNAAPIVGIDPA